MNLEALSVAAFSSVVVMNLIGKKEIPVAKPAMFCCSAPLLMFNDKIFSQEWLNYYDHLCKSPIFQMMI